MCGLPLVLSGALLQILGVTKREWGFKLSLLSVFRGISVVDVERADISFTVPLFWSCEYSHDVIYTLTAA